MEAADPDSDQNIMIDAQMDLSGTITDSDVELPNGELLAVLQHADKAMVASLRSSSERGLRTAVQQTACLYFSCCANTMLAVGGSVFPKAVGGRFGSLRSSDN